MVYFYSHLIQMDSLVEALSELELADHHKHHLSSLVDATLHKQILTLILDQLSTSDKVTFISMLEKDPKDPKIMEFLNTRVDKIEDQILTTSEKLKDELHEDIKESKKLHKK